MPSQRFTLWRSKRLRLPKRRAPAFRLGAAGHVRYSDALTTAVDIWIFLLGYYGSLLAIVLESLILTISRILLHALFPLQLCSQSVLRLPPSGYFGISMTDGNCYFRWWQRPFRRLPYLNNFVTQ